MLSSIFLFVLTKCLVKILIESKQLFLLSYMVIYVAIEHFLFFTQDQNILFSCSVYTLLEIFLVS